MIAAAAVLAPALATAPFAGVPGATIRSYPVRGNSVAAIRAALNAGGRVDRHDGAPVEAMTHWRFTWRWPGTPDGGCRLSAASVRFAATVTLPRLADPAGVPPDVLAAWRRYRAALEAHEARHVAHAYAARGQVLAAIRGSTCTRANRAASAVVAVLVADDVAYDRATRHGASEGAVFP